MKKFYLRQLLIAATLLFAVDVYSQCIITRTITGNSTVCQYTTVNYTTEPGMTGYSWSVTGGSYSPSFSNSINVNWLIPGTGTITVTYTDTNNCTGSSAPKNVTVIAKATPTITGNGNACQNSTGNTYVTEASQSNYNWGIIGGTITAGQGTNSVSVTWNTNGSQSLNVTYVSPNGCLSMFASKVIDVSPLTISITGNTTPCINSQYTYFTQTGKSSYNWSVVGGSILAGAGTSSIIVMWNTAGPQSVSVSYVDPLGCIATPSITQNVTVTNPPTPTIAGSSTACQYVAGIVYTTQPGMSSYNWSIGGPAFPPAGIITAGAGTNSVTVKWLSSGSQNLSVSYTNAGGCPASSLPFNVNVTPLPYPNISSGPTSLCQGVSGTYTAPAGQATYNWGAPGGTIVSGAGTNTVNIIWNVAGNRSASLNYGVVNGCQTVDVFYSTTVKETPVPSLSSTAGDSPLCHNSSTYYYTDYGQASYNWAVSSGGTITPGSSPNSIVVTWNATGPQWVSVNYTNSQGCTAATPTIKNEVINPLPVMTSPTAKTICSNYGTDLTLTSTLPSTYSWNVIDNPNITGESPNGGPILNQYLSNTSTSPQAVTYAVTANTVTTYCNSLPQTVIITVNPKPVASISGPDIGCLNTTTNYSTEAGNSSYTWGIFGGNIESGQGTNTVSVKWTATGTKQLNVSYINSYGCASTLVTKFVTVNARPVAAITSPNSSICNGGSTAISGTITATGAWTLTLSNGGGNVNGTGSGTWSRNVSPSATTNYSIASLVDANCSSIAADLTGSKIVIVNPRPVAAITSPNSTICNGGSTSVSGTITANGAWILTLSNGGGTVNGTGSGNWTRNVSPSTTTTYTIASLVDANCSSIPGDLAGSKTVSVNSRPTATITSPNASICIGGSTTILGTITAAGSWTLTLSNGVSVNGTGSGSWNKSVNPTSTTTYTIASLSDANCLSIPSDLLGSETVTVNSIPVVTVSPASSTICTGYSGVNLTASGASEYNWVPTNGLSATTGATVNANPTINSWPTVINYTVTGTTGGCTSSSATATVTGYITPTTTFFAESATTFCEGNSVRLNAWCEANVSYQWYRNDIPIYPSPYSRYFYDATVSGDYKVTLSSNYYACSYTTPVITVTVLPAPQPYVASSYDACTYGYTVLTAYGGSGVTGYQWSTYETNQAIYAYPGNEYSVVANYGSCTSSPSYYYIDACPQPECPDPYNPNCPCIEGDYQCVQARKRKDNGGTEETVQEESILGIYPNPANNEVTVQVPEKAEAKLGVSMISQFGHEVISSAIEKGEVKTILDTKNIADGVYIVLIKSKHGTMLTQKVIVKH